MPDVLGRIATSRRRRMPRATAPRERRSGARPRRRRAGRSRSRGSRRRGPRPPRPCGSPSSPASSKRPRRTDPRRSCRGPRTTRRRFGRSPRSSCRGAASSPRAGVRLPSPHEPLRRLRSRRPARRALASAEGPVRSPHLIRTAGLRRAASGHVEDVLTFRCRSGADPVRAGSSRLMIEEAAWRERSADSVEGRT